jgi:hypothetical protein
MGVKDIRIFDPETRTAHICTATGTTSHKTGTLRVDATGISLSIKEIFATLDAWNLPTTHHPLRAHDVPRGASVNSSPPT